jgi:hypothetical protein
MGKILCKRIKRVNVLGNIMGKGINVVGGRWVVMQVGSRYGEGIWGRYLFVRENILMKTDIPANKDFV